MTRFDKKPELIARLKDTFHNNILEVSDFRDDLTVVVDSVALLRIMEFLKTDNDFRMNYFVDVCGADYLPRSPRFEVVYHLYSTFNRQRIRVKVRVNDKETVPSVTGLWDAANWPERETFDMFGITFEGHPDMRRIYLAEDWEGFPLRKDYPLRGYKDKYNPFGEEKE